MSEIEGSVSSAVSASSTSQSMSSSSSSSPKISGKGAFAKRTSALILAAGQGTRMKSAKPKVLHAICGRPLVYFPVQAALEAGCDEVVVVVGHGRVEVSAMLAATFGEGRVKIAVQEEQRGTGDAARAGLSAVSADAERLLVFYGDVPLLRAEDVAAVVQRLDLVPAATLSLAICTVDEPHGYGRVMRDAAGKVTEIREQKDLQSDAERANREINPGIYAFPVDFARSALAQLKPNNAQGEYYLTDLVALAARSGTVETVVSRADVMDGVNDRRQLAEAEEKMYKRISDQHRAAGVTVRGDARIEVGVVLGADAIVEAGCVLRGATKIGAGATLDIGCVLTNVVVDEGAVLKPYTVASDATIGARAQIGPFSHLRPESVIGEDAHVGNFVELKKTSLGKGAKANHLAYLGDGVVGAGANIGAGTIFCNYDGFSKHVTTIGEGAFIGSDSQLVAPLTIGAGAYVATGTTVTRDIPANALAISRVKQENKADYALKLKAKLKATKDAAKK